MKKQDLSVLKAIILREMAGSSTCNECGGAMYEGMCTECGYMEEDDSPDQLTINGKVVKNYTQNGDTSFSVEYADGTKGKIYVNNDGWDELNDRNQLAIRLRGKVQENHEGTDHEVSMANNSIDSILWAANELKKHLQGGERDIPAWIQDHITNAENYILQAAKNYHEYGSQEDDFSDMDAADYEEETDEMSLNSLMEAKEKNVKEGVKKVGKKYAVYSKKGKRLGTHTSKAKANKQMAAIEISKQGK